MFAPSLLLLPIVAYKPQWARFFVLLPKINNNIQQYSLFSFIIIFRACEPVGGATFLIPSVKYTTKEYIKQNIKKK